MNFHRSHMPRRVAGSQSLVVFGTTGSECESEMRPGRRPWEEAMNERRGKKLKSSAKHNIILCSVHVKLNYKWNGHDDSYGMTTLPMSLPCIDPFAMHIHWHTGVLERGPAHSRTLKKKNLYLTEY